MSSISTLVKQLSDSNLASCKIAVVGDVCIDHYYFVDSSVSEVSVETGLETMSVQSSEWHLGAAGNVAETLRSLGVGTVDLYGVIGDDVEGDILLSLCKKARIATDGIVTQKEHWRTNMYHKIIKEGGELPRFDSGNFNKITEATQDELLVRLQKKLASYRCVILNEQLLSGLTDSRFVECINDLIATSNKTIWLADTRHFVGTYKRVIYKVNNHEMSADSAVEFSQKWEMPLIVTLGKNGALAIKDGTRHVVRGMDFNQTIDTVGAGDAFIAGTAVALAGGVDFFDAVEIGNLAANASVLTLYKTGHPTFAEISKIIEEPSWRYHAEIAENPSLVRIVPNSQVQIIDEKKFASVKKFPKVAIFDNDGTISVLRQGWEIVMEAVMTEEIIAGKNVGEDMRAQIIREVKTLIEKTTGIQTINQMHLLIPIIKRYGFAENVLSAEAYKDTFTARLKKAMHDKVEALKRGELNSDDLTIKGSVAFLTKLRDAGTKLYLASGTDQDDVVNECTMLGYAHLFEGRIRGSVGDVKNDPKKVVIQEIVKELKTQGIVPADCCIFGDGPVEMREARENGFFAVGVLSDERQRFGVNMAKFSRLVLAGADVLIPDFSQVHHLYDRAAL